VSLASYREPEKKTSPISTVCGFNLLETSENSMMGICALDFESWVVWGEGNGAENKTTKPQAPQNPGLYTAISDLL
jgi:hypothetical protein